MIEAIFNQPGYMIAKKALDVTQLRQEAIASNIANLETPNYRRLDVAPQFDAELQKAAASRNISEINQLQPSISVDSNAVANSKDGNTVSLEDELLRMSRNTLENTMQTQLVSWTLTRLRMAITGKSL